jgi:CelD/BcsL family acetyltransferase involved in cellulose biosynthesis
VRSAADLSSLPAFDGIPRDIRLLAMQSVPVEDELPKTTKLRDAIRYVPAHFNHYSIEIRGGFDDYMSGLSGKSRHEMARKVRRFVAHAEGRQELREYREPSEIPEFVRLASDLSKMTYQGRLLAVGLPDSPEFVAELVLAAGRGDVRGYLLSIAGRPVAYGYCRAEGDLLAFEHTGYDPALATHSPGIYLLQEMLKRVHAENRFRVFDFGSGDAQYKRSYATTSRRCATVLQFRKSFRNRLVVTSHRALTAFSDGCVRLLDRIGIKDRVKRLFRRSN